MRGPIHCPLCRGHGILPHGFYAHPAGQSFGSNNTAPETCRTCHGRGIVWVDGYRASVQLVQASAAEKKAVGE